jgi:type VI secretion system secreted protein VgrG
MVEQYSEKGTGYTSTRRLRVTVAFPPHAEEQGPIADLAVHRYQLRDGLSELFDLTLQVISTDPALDLHKVVGETAKVNFLLEPEGGQPHVEGMVIGVRQLSDPLVQTSASDTYKDGSKTSTYYELTLAPPLWLLTRRTDHRIFEAMSAVEIVKKVLEEYGGRVAAPGGSVSPSKRRYTVQYGETDYDFIARILAEEGITWYFDHQNQSKWVLLDQTPQNTSKAGGKTPFIPQANLSAPGGWVFNVTVAAHMDTSASHVRDYNYKKASFQLDKDGKPVDGLFTHEEKLEAYRFEVGKFNTDGEGQKRADDLLHALRAQARTFTFEANFTRGPGQRIEISDHPRSDCNGEFVVVRVRSILDDGGGSPNDPVTHLHLLECVPLATPFVPPRRPKPRIHGTHTAFVVAPADGSITHPADPQDDDEAGGADPYGRVRVQFRWARKGGATRWVRVSQAWAGSGYGFFALPREGDEVVISYLDGDPDQPLVTGRVHNSERRNPIRTEDAKKPIAAWRSQTLGKDEQGYNEVLMDDSKGEERLNLHAQRDYTRVVEHDSTVYVKHNDFLTVDWNKTDKIKRAYSMSAGSITLSTGPYTLYARMIKEIAKEWMLLKAHDLVNVDSDTQVSVKAPEVALLGDSAVFVKGGAVTITGGKIVLESGGSKITIQDSGIDIESSGPVNVKGAPINLN